MANRTICPSCGLEFQPEYIGDVVFDKYFSRLFIEVMKRVKTGLVSWKAIDKDGNDFVKTEIVSAYFLASTMNDKNDGSRVHDLKFWNLIYQRPEWYHQGIYVITDLGIEFMRGHVSVQRKITVNKRTCKIIKAEGETTLRTALRDRYPEWDDFLNDWLSGKPMIPVQGELF